MLMIALNQTRGGGTRRETRGGELGTDRLFAFCMGNGVLSEVAKWMLAKPARRPEDGESPLFCSRAIRG